MLGFHTANILYFRQKIAQLEVAQNNLAFFFSYIVQILYNSDFGISSYRLSDRQKLISFRKGKCSKNQYAVIFCAVKVERNKSAFVQRKMRVFIVKVANFGYIIGPRGIGPRGIGPRGPCLRDIDGGP